MKQFRANTFINYLTLLLVIVIGVFVVRISTELNKNELQTKQGVQNIQNQVSCIATYFNTPNRTGNTRLGCTVMP